MAGLREQLARLTDPIHVELGDRDDMRRKLPAVTERARVARVIREHQSALKDLGDRAEYWERLEAMLRELVPDAPVDVSADGENVPHGQQSSDRRTLGSVDSAVGILEEAGVPMTVAEVHKRLPQFSRKTVGWALWKAKQLDRAQTTPEKGVYAPMSYKPAELIPTVDTFATHSEGGET